MRECAGAAASKHDFASKEGQTRAAECAKRVELLLLLSLSSLLLLVVVVGVVIVVLDAVCCFCSGSRCYC